jgi:hypothetical protein
MKFLTNKFTEQNDIYILCPIYIIVFSCENSLQFYGCVRSEWALQGSLGKIWGNHSGDYEKFYFWDTTQSKQESRMKLLHAGFLLRLLFNPEEGVDIILLHVGWLSMGYMVLYSRRQNSAT